MLETTSYDDGKTWIAEETQVLAASYFFLSEDMIEIERNAFNIINLMTNFGGFASSMFTIFSGIAYFINLRYQAFYLIKDLFYVLEGDHSLKCKDKEHCVAEMV